MTDNNSSEQGTLVNWEDREIVGDILTLDASAIDSKFSNFAVRTPRKQFEDFFDELQADLNEDPLIYTRISNAVCQYTRRQLKIMFRRQNKKWDDWCNDVSLYFACRYILFGEVIPVIQYSKKN